MNNQLKIKIDPADRPDTESGEELATLRQISQLIQRVAWLVPLPGSPSLEACVEWLEKEFELKRAKAVQVCTRCGAHHGCQREKS